MGHGVAEQSAASAHSNAPSSLASLVHTRQQHTLSPFSHPSSFSPSSPLYTHAQAILCRPHRGAIYALLCSPPHRRRPRSSEARRREALHAQRAELSQEAAQGAKKTGGGAEEDEAEEMVAAMEAEEAIELPRLGPFSTKLRPGCTAAVGRHKRRR